MIKRRQFLAELSTTGLAIALPYAKSENLLRAKGQSTRSKANIDWAAVREDFLASKAAVINLNNGSSSNMPVPVLDEYTRLTREVNSFAPYHVMSSWKDIYKTNLKRLAALTGAENGHLAFVRNTTEAVNIILSGINWQKGDEIITANWDYPFVEYSVDQLRRKHGIKVVNIDHHLPGLSDEDIIKKFEERISAKTRLCIVTWMTHREGQILPLEKICKTAHQLGVKVLADGAHMVGQCRIDLSKSRVDYFASSLHKWLNAPLGSGMLYIRNDRMEEHFPYLSIDPKMESSPSKYEYLGTRPFQNLAALGSAIDYLELTGIDAKQSRLHELSSYWINTAQDFRNVIIHTDTDRCCACAAFSIGNMPSAKIKKQMAEEFGVHLKSSAIGKTPTIRVSPNIYTNFKDLDRFLEGLESIASKY
ncbi:MAG: aminotransferase class V-fold PLP-dependent enzyme [Saprospiraceae bacterium]